MRKPLDKSRKPKDSPPVSRDFFITTYADVINATLPRLAFAYYDAERLIEDVILGRQGPSTLLKKLAKKHGARPGRVGNFLRGLR